MLQSKLRTVLGTRGPTAALKDGLVRPVGFEFDFDEEVTDVIGAFRRMVRNSEFDVCEMALSTYLCAREHGKGPAIGSQGLKTAGKLPKRLDIQATIPSDEK